MGTEQKKYRIGLFSVSFAIIEHSPELVRALMGRCIVVKAQQSYPESFISYVALVSGFREIAQGESIPEYRVDVSLKPNPSEFGFTFYECGDSDYMLAMNMGIRLNQKAFKELPK